MKSGELFPTKRLKWMADIRPSGVDKHSVEGEPEVRLCNYTDVYRNDIITNDMPFMAATASEEQIRRFALQPGDVIITKDSETPDDIAVPALVTEPLTNVVCGYHLTLLRPLPGTLGTFLFWCLKAAEVSSQMSLAAQGVTRFAITIGAMGRVLLPCPDEGRQRLIAEFLGREVTKIDDLISEQKRLNVLLQEKRQAVITHSVTRGLDPDCSTKEPGIPWLGQIPAHWEVARAKLLFRQSDLPPPEDAEVVTCFRDGQVTLRRNRWEDGFMVALLEAGYQGVRIGQLVLHSMDAFAGAIGISESDGKCSPEYIICDPKRDDLVPAYFAKLLRVMAHRGFILAACPSVRERAPRIRFPDFADMLLPFPPLDEQLRILEFLAREEASISTLEVECERAIAVLKERRAALISAAVTGKIDVRGLVPLEEAA